MVLRSGFFLKGEREIGDEPKRVCLISRAPAGAHYLFAQIENYVNAQSFSLNNLIVMSSRDDPNPVRFDHATSSPNNL